MTIVRTTAKGQVVIPVEVRKKYHIVKGTKVKIEEKNGVIVIKPLLANPVKDAKGLFKAGNSALKVLIEDRQSEAKE
ncbi:MAG: AbrB/MazE/SpoVT family DNA-binding domain-containing protein [Actinomycetota bacterium]|nr:AbrB/MazE/SpoVT family DNA-binding domain-containing protein [Actinomycetota bacterium]